MTEVVRLADLRRASVADRQDLREWQFREKWSNNDTTTVLAWAGDEGCVIHEDVCSYHPSGPPTTAGRVDEARQLFAIEQPKGTFRYFGFCGHCLTEKIPNYGWKPTARDLELLETMQSLLNDLRLLGDGPVSKPELVQRIGRYGTPINRRELDRLLDYYKQVRSAEAPDLSVFVK